MNFNFKKLSLAALAAVGLTFGGYAIHYQTRSAVDAREEEKVPVVDFSKYSLAGLMNIIKEPQHGDHMIGAGKEVIARMEKQKLSLSGLAFSKEGKLYALPNDLEEEDFSQLASGSVIAHRDSGLMKLFKKYLGTTTTPLVESNVDWTIFSPNVKIRKTDVGGSSYGEKIVFLDTLEWGAKVPFFDLAVRLTHEAQHEATPKETPPLLDELNAYEKEVELLSWLLKRTTSKDKKYKLSLSEEEKSYLEERLLPQRERQVARGKYLASFGNNFAGAYPHNTLLADNFLQLRAPQEFLGKYEHIATGNPLDTELTLAVQTALIAYRFNVAHAAEIYEKMLQEGTALKKENARSALNYLFPKGMNQKGSAKGFDGKGILKIPRGDFWDYFISDIKSLFVNEKVPETYADLPEQKVQKYIPQKKREEKQRKDFETHEVRMALTPSELIESELNEKFFQLHGDPDKEKGDWTCKGWQADERGRTIVMYQSGNPLSSSRQEIIYLTKQDTYQQGKFAGTFWNFLPAYQDQTSIPQVWNGTAWVKMEGFVIYPRQKEEEEKKWILLEPLDGKLYYEGKEVR